MKADFILPLHYFRTIYRSTVESGRHALLSSSIIHLLPAIIGHCFSITLKSNMGDCRRVGVAVDFSPCSRKALQWAVDNLVREGDHLIVVTIRPEGYYESGEVQLWETTGSPLIPLSEMEDSHLMKKKYDVTPDPETLDILATASRQKEITVLLKIFWGDAREKICESVESIPLDCLVVGNRGLGKIKRAIMGSVSNFVVNHASCPVTVVKSHE